jgi:hypothetical protein
MNPTGDTVGARSSPPAADDVKGDEKLRIATPRPGRIAAPNQIAACRILVPSLSRLPSPVGMREWSIAAFESVQAGYVVSRRPIDLRQGF